MDLTRVILGQITTEKSERQKVAQTYTLRVAQEATKVDVKQALKKYYDLDVTSVRVMLTRPKARFVGEGRILTKRKRMKKVMVTLAPKSKALDLVQFKTFNT